MCPQQPARKYLCVRVTVRVDGAAAAPYVLQTMTPIKFCGILIAVISIIALALMNGSNRSVAMMLSTAPGILRRSFFNVWLWCVVCCCGFFF